MKNICVYLGANKIDNILINCSVIELGKEIVKNECALVYGGSSLGLMGLLAGTVKNLGGRVVGIITGDLLDKEKPMENLDELIIVDTIQERKRLMQLRSDAFIVLPGGLGTLEECFETWNAIKIGIIKKPIGFLNVDRFFDSFFVFIKNCKDSGFISSEHMSIPVIENKTSILIQKLVAH